jgi:hypothetical protein
VSTLSAIDLEALEKMATAGVKITDCYRVLKKSKANVVGELIKDAGEFYEWDHYPKGDVYDNGTHSQYYYHAHPSENRINQLGSEHGHFHTFLRPRGMPKDVKPVKLADYKKPKAKAKNDDICHLIGIAMDRRGIPIRLFTVNRWVTGETWYDSNDVIRLLDCFDMDLSFPSWPVNVWITNLVALFRPQIETLVQQRDTMIMAHQKKHPTVNTYEDRSLEVTSFMDIDVDKQLKLLNKEITARNKNNHG